MNLLNKKLLVPIAIGSFLLFLASAGNPPDGNTGAPFDGLCSSCHGGGSYNGTVDITGFPSSITPNTNYPITITATATSGTPVVGGFQIVAVDASNVNAGDLIAGSGSGTTFFNGREYLDHRGAKSYSGNSVSWSFNWTSPSGPGGSVITMYYASNMANGNGGTSGDKIIKSSKSGTLSGGTPLSVNITSKKNVSCFGGSDGNATAAAGGGMPPYTYLWSNGKTGSTVTLLTAATYKVTVTDATTTTASATTTVTQPTALLQQLSVVKNVSCPGGKDGSILATATGGTSPYNFVYSSGSPNNLFAGMYSVTISDANSCTVSSSVIVTQPDTFSVSLVTLKNPNCPLDSNGQLKINVTGATPPYNYLWSSGETTNQIINKKIGIYKVTVTDSKNCTSVKSYQLKSADTIAPILVAKNSKVYLSSSGKTLPKISDYIVTNTDNCDALPKLTINIDTFRCSQIGKNNYVITSMDSTGNKSLDTIEIEVIDTLKPIITCPVDKTINCEASSDSTNTGSASATDNCKAVIMNISHSDLRTNGGCNDNYLISRTWNAIDSSNNLQSCLQVITVQDTTKPVIACPTNVTIHCEADNTPVSTGILKAKDNCTDFITNITFTDTRSNGSCNDNYNLNRTWTAVDSCGNAKKCLQTITVFDTTRPSITCPVNVTVNCEADYTPTNTGILKASDNCTNLITNITFRDFKIEGSCNDNSYYQRIWTAFDSCGNSNNCMQIISIQDTTRPSITCPVNVTMNCEADNTPNNTGVSTATDNCTDVVTNITFEDSRINGSCNYNYIFNRTWTATDSCGNSRSCLQIITIQDTTRPKVFCPEDLTINCDVSPTPSRTGFPSAIDNCTSRVTNFTFIETRTNGNCNYNYTLDRIWTGTDSCGNSNNCEQNILVQDTNRPSIKCPSYDTIECQSGTSPLYTGYATATDNCTITVNDIYYTDTRTNGSCDDNYNINRIWTAVDSCGNFKSCYQLIIVFDTTRPHIFCPENVTIDCKENSSPARTGTATSTDNCTNIISNINYSDEVIFGGPNNNYVINRIWKANDSCGNQNNCIQTITALDTLKLDSVKITNSSNANDGKIEVFFTGADSLNWYDAFNEQYINNTGIALSPGDYFVRAFKGQCVFIFGPYHVELIISTIDPEELNVRAYPIPFSDKIILFSDLKSELRYNLSNAQGNTINRGVFKNNTTLDASYLSSGIYFLKCYGIKKSSTIRLIKI